MIDNVCGLFTTPVSKFERGWKDYVASLSPAPAATPPITAKKAVPVANDAPLSPFDAYSGDGSYHWPDLYTEVDEMLETCVLIYPMVEIRRKARSSDFDGLSAEKVLYLPQTHTEIMQVVSHNKDKISDTSLKSEFFMKALEAADKRSRLHLSSTTIVAVEDKHEKEELVYSIEVNHQRKRVVVCFRGSVTKMDWAMNFEIYMKEVPNPMRAHASQSQTIRVHNGFHDYLLLPRDTDNHGISTYKEIMYSVYSMLQTHPGFKLYVTGHSMGAALATLFAFGAAAEADTVVPKPVSLFTFAGPYVGDQSFREAHQLLESLGKLRHLRVTNHKDIVTIVPKLSFRFSVFPGSHVGALFKHVGMNMRLFDGSTPLEISYPRAGLDYLSSTADELSRGWEQSLFSNFAWNPIDYWTWPTHNVQSYTERVDANRTLLHSLYLNEMYGRKEIVGDLLADC
jgi:predicted lipase